jgi:hypothetical protein
MLITTPFIDDALIRYAQITAMPHPNYSNVESFRTMIFKRIFGVDGIRGAGNFAWGDPSERLPETRPLVNEILPFLSSIFWKRDRPLDKRDLVTVQPLQVQMGLIRWIREEWIPFYHYYLRDRLRRLFHRQRRGGVSSIIPNRKASC